MSAFGEPTEPRKMVSVGYDTMVALRQLLLAIGDDNQAAVARYVREVANEIEIDLTVVAHQATGS